MDHSGQFPSIRAIRIQPADRRCVSGLLEKTLFRDPDSEFDRKPRILPPPSTLQSCTWLNIIHIYLTTSGRDRDVTVAPTRSVVDEEALLTHIDEDSQEAIVSNLGLHWVNDIPGESSLALLSFLFPFFSMSTSYSTEADVGDAICVCESQAY